MPFSTTPMAARMSWINSKENTSSSIIEHCSLCTAGRTPCRRKLPCPRTGAAYARFIIIKHFPAEIGLPPRRRTPKISSALHKRAAGAGACPFTFCRPCSGNAARYTASCPQARHIPYLMLFCTACDTRGAPCGPKSAAQLNAAHLHGEASARRRRPALYPQHPCNASPPWIAGIVLPHIKITHNKKSVFQCAHAPFPGNAHAHRCAGIWRCPAGPPRSGSAAENASGRAAQRGNCAAMPSWAAHRPHRKFRPLFFHQLSGFRRTMPRKRV